MKINYKLQLEIGWIPLKSASCKLAFLEITPLFIKFIIPCWSYSSFKVGNNVGNFLGSYFFYNGAFLSSIFNKNMFIDYFAYLKKTLKYMIIYLMVLIYS